MKKFSMFVVAVIVVSIFSPGAVFSQHKLESWYFYFGLGWADPQYANDVEDVVKFIEDQPGIDHVTGGLDLPGFYWRKGERTIIGGTLNAFGDRFEDNNSDVTVQLTGFTLAFSAMHFLTNEVGKGFFVRGDVGPARFVLDIEGAGPLSGRGRSKWGFGALIGGGFGIPVSGGTRILLNANYAFRRVEGETVGAFAITVGGLF